MNPLSDDKIFISDIFFKQILPEIDVAFLEFAEQNKVKSSYKFGYIIEVYYKLINFLL